MNRLIRMPFVSIALIFGFLWTSSGALAQSESLGGNAHIQIKPIMTPTQPLPGSFFGQTYPLTPVMTVPNAGDISFVCQRTPRVADAILQYFQRNPVHLTQGRRVDLKTINKNNAKIAADVNKALGQDVVSEIHFTDVVSGSMARGVMARLPFAKIQGCSRVLKEYEERLKKVEGK